MINIYKYDGAIYSASYVTPEMYGAKGDGTTDDTIAIQNAVNNQGLIVFESTKNYAVTTSVRLKRNTVLDLNGATLTFPTTGGLRIFVNFLTTDTNFTAYNGNGNITIKNGTIVGGNISFAHGENILLENIRFKNSLSPHFLEICACKNYVIRHCSFEGVSDNNISVYEYINIDPATYYAFPLLPNGSAFFDGAKNDGIIVEDCYFALGNGLYAYGYNAFGVHGVSGQSVKHKNIYLKNNILLGFTGCGFRINDMENVFIDGNNIRVVGDGIMIGDVGSVDNVVVKNNYVVSSNGQKLVRTNGQYTNLTVANNVTQGDTQEF